MPITAKLSRNFYERLGDDVASELVEWFNSVDEEYRRQYREANDLNWERFKEFHRAEQAEFRREMDSRFNDVTGEFARLRAEVAADFDRIRIDVAAQFARVRAEIADFRTEMMKWMFIYWTGSMVTLGGLMIVLLRTR